MEKFNGPGPDSIFDVNDPSSRKYERRIRIASITLYLVAAIQVVLTIILISWYNFSYNVQIYSILSGSVIALIFLGLAKWAGKTPFFALLSAVIFYLVLVGLEMLVSMELFLWFIVFRVFLMTLLIRGLMATYQLKKIRNTLGV